MRRLFVLIAIGALNASFAPGLASECPSIKQFEFSRARAMVPGHPSRSTDIETTCRAYAASFYEFVTLRQAAARCTDGRRHLPVLDAEINVLNDLLATKCSG